MDTKKLKKNIKKKLSRANATYKVGKFLTKANYYAGAIAGNVDAKKGKTGKGLKEMASSSVKSVKKAKGAGNKAYAVAANAVGAAGYVRGAVGYKMTAARKAALKKAQQASAKARKKFGK